MLEVMGSASRPETLPQQELPPVVTLSAALPYLSFTICLMSCFVSWSAISASAARVVFGQLEPLRLGRVLSDDRHLAIGVDVVVEVVDLPLHAVRVLDPELVLVGVAAVDPHLLAHGQAGGLHA